MSDIKILLRQAVERFNAMPPHEQKAHWKAQQKSWVVGEMLIEHPELSREYVEQIYDRVVA
jgi:hypothetical protein